MGNRNFRAVISPLFEPLLLVPVIVFGIMIMTIFIVNTDVILTQLDQMDDGTKHLHLNHLLKWILD